MQYVTDFEDYKLLDTDIYKARYEKLYEQTKDFIAAVARSPELVKEFICSVLSKSFEKELSRNWGNCKEER